MHLLAAKPGGLPDDEGIVDLQQDPAQIAILSSQDSSLSLLARTLDAQSAGYPSVRLANLLYLAKPASTDLYIDKVLQHCDFVLVVLLGGQSYWSYGVEQLRLLQPKGVRVAFIPGDDKVDLSLQSMSNIPAQDLHRLWRYFREGGQDNMQGLYAFLQHQYFAAGESKHKKAYKEPKPLAKTQIYHPQCADATLQDWRLTWSEYKKPAARAAPVAAIIFYRSHLQTGNTEAFDQFCEICLEVGLSPLPIATASLKDPLCLAVVNELLHAAAVSVVINTTGFSMGLFEASSSELTSGLAGNNIPVLQAIMAGITEPDWEKSSVGLYSSDIAMNIALPEVDGRIISRAISFKAISHRCERSQSDIVGYRLQPTRARFVAELARKWALLGDKANAQKRIALILANYPGHDARIGNGVGLDTPASVINILRRLASTGFEISELPPHGDALIKSLQGSVTNTLDDLALRGCLQSLDLADYGDYFGQLPPANQQAILQRWGPAAEDPKVRQGRIMVAGLRLGNLFVGLQPTRGYEIDISASYHDPDLVPPHNYLAFYFWLRHHFLCDACIHVGKHGNLEWLPGKGVALSNRCWPEITLGPMPHLYPFIVNDPGEGSQAKRRAQAVIVDHLIPPMTRAESYGVLQQIEALVDEYYQALGMDSVRCELLRSQILEAVNKNNIRDELGLAKPASDEHILNQLDNYLCELKEAQIRDGLHILGESPQGQQQIDSLVALVRNCESEGLATVGILHAIAADFRFQGFDPLGADHGVAWSHERPARLASLSTQTWRHHGDTRERLAILAQYLVTSYVVGEADLAALNQDLGVDATHVREFLLFMRSSLAPRLQQCGEHELRSIVAGLSGKFVLPGPSGAPTRGRLDVLPTGRNFYSVDTRAIPTATAWTLGQASAELIIQRYMQDNGDYLRRIGISVWGTSTMRTGGDDIAQAYALMGIKPRWSQDSNRVIGYEIIPGFLLGRPRVDVTLRISGFFRDAFANVVKLFDRAVQDLIDYEEPGDINSVRLHVQDEIAIQQSQGVSASEARRRAGWRIFGAKPGSYGAGLKGLIDHREWKTSADLAAVYVNWGAYAYSEQQAGVAAPDEFRQRLTQLQAVVQNQDNREHDILDSDDYYQFQGGMANAVRCLGDHTPEIYHGDHSNPSAPRIYTLKEEINRVMRSRVVNPKWINAVQRHAYKGAFEMSATVDYLFAYDATTSLVDDYQYGMVAESYLYDAKNQQFLREHNPHALREIAERLIEAMQRGMWQEPGLHQQKIEEILLDIEDSLERAEV
ncbi:MAG: cobaltochelatase subunit CobN [Thiohalomonadales bacterium]